jgi:hypothetical protein
MPAASFLRIIAAPLGSCRLAAHRLQPIEHIAVEGDEIAALAVRASLSLLGDARPCLSSIRPELLAIGRERGSNEHEDGQTEGNFAYYQ